MTKDLNIIPSRRKGVVMSRLLAVAFGIPMGFLITMALDRTPPYYRDRGEIVAAPPGECGLPDSMATSEVKPGHCVYTLYYIRVVNDSCVPIPGGHVTRFIERGGVQRELPKTPPMYGAGTNRPFSSPLIRAWTYPEWGADWDRPGEALYKSAACYTCGFGPFTQNLVQKVFPVCVDTPAIRFNISSK